MHTLAAQESVLDVPMLLSSTHGQLRFDFWLACCGTSLRCWPLWLRRTLLWIPLQLPGRLCCPSWWVAAHWSLPSPTPFPPGLPYSPQGIPLCKLAGW